MSQYRVLTSICPDEILITDLHFSSGLSFKSKILHWSNYVLRRWLEFLGSLSFWFVITVIFTYLSVLLSGGVNAPVANWSSFSPGLVQYLIFILPLLAFISFPALLAVFSFNAQDTYGRLEARWVEITVKGITINPLKTWLCTCCQSFPQ